VELAAQLGLLLLLRSRRGGHRALGGAAAMTLPRYKPGSEQAGAIIRDAAKACGLTQFDLAAMLGMGQSQISEIMVGKRPLSAAIALRFEDALAVSADVLMHHQAMAELEAARKRRKK
jgi:addiction module HigA family antidote